jgi:4-hydroxybenzoate polyprenyltransferase
MHRNLFDVLVNNRIHVFIIPVVATLFWNLSLQLELPFAYYLLITLNTAGNYLYNMLTDWKEDAVNYPDSGRFVGPKYKITRPLILLCFLGSLYLGFLSGWQFIVYGFVLNLLGMLYGFPFKRKNKEVFRIKTVPVLKNAYSALFWSVALLLTPYFYIHQQPDSSLIFTIVIAFIMAFFVELLWDVRDIQGDRLANIRTIPILLGVASSRVILHLLNAATFLLVLYGTVTGVYPASYYVMLGHSLIVLFFLQWYFRQNDKQFGSHLYLVIATLAVVSACVVEYSPKIHL